MRKDQSLVSGKIPVTVLTEEGDTPSPSLLYSCIFDPSNFTVDYRSTDYIKKDDFFKALEATFGEDTAYYTVFECIDTVRSSMIMVIPSVNWMITLILSTGDTNQDRVRMAVKAKIGNDYLSREEFMEYDESGDVEDESNSENPHKVAKFTKSSEFNVVVGCHIYTVVDDSYIEEFYKHYDKYKYPEVKIKTKDAVFTLGNSGMGGLTLNKHYLNNGSYGKDIITHNYNEDFGAVYAALVEFLSNDDSGLVLLKGAPGTGKTSLLIHLTSISEELDKKIVFVPSAFASVLTDPSFLTFATTHLCNSILVLEDAEEALLSRDKVNGGAVTNILNISDGILGKILKTKVIATVNKQEALDDALFRKGRLKLEYTFNPLETNRANQLLETLGKTERVTSPTTLADLYNIDKNPKMNEEKAVKKVGFGR